MKEKEIEWNSLTFLVPVEEEFVAALSEISQNAKLNFGYQFRGLPSAKSAYNWSWVENTDPIITSIVNAATTETGNETRYFAKRFQGGNTFRNSPEESS